MKKYLILFVSSLMFVSCETNTVEVSKTAGEWFMSGDNQGKPYEIGSNDHVDIVLEVVRGYAEKNPEAMMKHMADTVKFYPADAPGVFDVPFTSVDFIIDRQSNWDSLTREIYYIAPLKISGNVEEGWGSVDTAFKETRYLKDGSVEADEFFEKFVLNNNKIVTVLQWSRPAND